MDIEKEKERSTETEKESWKPVLLTRNVDNDDESSTAKSMRYPAWMEITIYGLQSWLLKHYTKVGAQQCYGGWMYIGYLKNVCFFNVYQVIKCQIHNFVDGRLGYYLTHR